MDRNGTKRHVFGLILDDLSGRIKDLDLWLAGRVEECLDRARLMDQERSS